MTLEKLRNEFVLGDLSFGACGANLFVYIRTNGKLIGSIGLVLQNDGSWQVVEINPVVDQKGSKPLMAIAEREKIPFQILTKSTLRQAAELIY